jgi:hypothetical protein
MLPRHRNICVAAEFPVHKRADISLPLSQRRIVEVALESSPDVQSQPSDLVIPTDIVWCDAIFSETIGNIYRYITHVIHTIFSLYQLRNIFMIQISPSFLLIRSVRFLSNIFPARCMTGLRTVSYFSDRLKTLVNVYLLS